MDIIEEWLMHAPKIVHVLLKDSSMNMLEEGLIQTPEFVHVLYCLGQSYGSDQEGRQVV